MESQSQLDPNEWNLKGNRPRRLSDFSVYPKDMYDGKPFYVVSISNGKEITSHYTRNPATVAHKLKAARKKRHLSFVYVMLVRSKESGTLKEYQAQKQYVRNMGTINWLPYEKRWQRWNKWKGRR